MLKIKIRMKLFKRMNFFINLKFTKMNKTRDILILIGLSNSVLRKYKLLGSLSLRKN